MGALRRGGARPNVSDSARRERAPQQGGRGVRSLRLPNMGLLLPVTVHASTHISDSAIFDEHFEFWDEHFQDDTRDNLNGDHSAVGKGSYVERHDMSAHESPT